MELTAQQKEQLCDALCDAFDADGLEQMVLYKLGKKLYVFVSRGVGMQTLAFRLIEQAHQEGFVEALIRAMHVSRGTNPRVRDFLNTHFAALKTPIAPEQLAQDVESGLTATARLSEDVDIQHIVGRFQADFQTTRTHVEELSKYKALHDRLHRLQVGFLSLLVDAVEKSQPGKPSVHPLDLYAYQLRREVEPARADATGLPNAPEEVGWIDKLRMVADQVGKAGEAGDPAKLRPALVLFRQILAEAPRINSSLASTAARLGLGKLIEAMTEIRDTLATGGNDESGALPELREAVGGLQTLKPRLDGLVEEHYAWQKLDKEFTAAERETGSTLEERFPLWETVSAELRRLCQLSPEKDWSKFLMRLLEALTQTGAIGDTGLFVERFVTFRTVARDRFLEVDLELLRLVEQLARWAAPIDMLVRLATHDHDN